VTPSGLRVVGLGNAMRGDDAVGLIVARHLRELLPAADVIERSGEPAGLLEALGEGAEAVVLVDAVLSGGLPGEVHRLDASDVALPIAASASTHGLGLAETIELGRALGRLPARLLVYGIEGRSLELGAPLSPEVASAAVVVAAEIRQLLEEAEHTSIADAGPDSGGRGHRPDAGSRGSIALQSTFVARAPGAYSGPGSSTAPAAAGV